MSRGSIILLSGAGLALVAAAAFVLLPRLSLPDDLLAAAPKQTTAVIHIRVGRLLESKAFDQLIRQRGHYAGVEKVQKLCGYDPVAHVDEALLFALTPEERGLPDWGVVLKGDLDPRKLAECVKITLKKQGRTSQMKQEDVDDVPCVVSSRGDSRVCALRNGLVGGTDATVRAALATLKDEQPSALRNPSLTKLWATLDTHADARGVAFVPEKIRGLLQTLARPFLPPSLQAVTRVQAGVGQLTASDTVRGRLALDTPNATDARALADAAEHMLQGLMEVPALALTPAGRLVKETTVSSEGTQVRFAGDYPLHALGTVMDLLPTAQQLFAPGSGSGAPTPAVTQPKAPSPSPPPHGTSKLGPKDPGQSPSNGSKAPSAP